MSVPVSCRYPTVSLVDTKQCDMTDSPSRPATSPPNADMDKSCPTSRVMSLTVLALALMAANLLAMNYRRQEPSPASLMATLDTLRAMNQELQAVQEAQGQVSRSLLATSRDGVALTQAMNTFMGRLAHEYMARVSEEVLVKRAGVWKALFEEAEKIDVPAEMEEHYERYGKFVAEGVPIIPRGSW